MTVSPFISVIIPHLNQPTELERCLHSLMGQQYPADRFEIVVVDNGSCELPASITGRFSRTRLVRESEPGPGPARNRGVIESSGEILAFIDADCFADKNWLSVVERELNGSQSSRIVGGDVRIAHAHAGRISWLEAYETVFNYQQRLYIEKKGFSGTGNLAVTRSDYERVGPFAGIEVAEDRDWGQRAQALGIPVTYASDMIVFHPARTSLADLRNKWSRHLLHDLAEWRRAGRGRLLWILRAVAVAGSLARDVPRALFSNRLNGFLPRLTAGLVLVYIRLFRAAHMIGLLTNSDGNRSAMFWNRPGDPDRATGQPSGSL